MYSFMVQDQKLGGKYTKGHPIRITDVNTAKILMCILSPPKIARKVTWVSVGDAMMWHVGQPRSQNASTAF